MSQDQEAIEILSDDGSFVSSCSVSTVSATVVNDEERWSTQMSYPAADESEPSFSLTKAPRMIRRDTPRKPRQTSSSSLLETATTVPKAKRISLSPTAAASSRRSSQGPPKKRQKRGAEPESPSSPPKSGDHKRQQKAAAAEKTQKNKTAPVTHQSLDNVKKPNPHKTLPEPDKVDVVNKSKKTAHDSKKKKKEKSPVKTQAINKQDDSCDKTSETVNKKKRNAPQADDGATKAKAAKGNTGPAAKSSSVARTTKSDKKTTSTGEQPNKKKATATNKAPAAATKSNQITPKKKKRTLQDCVLQHMMIAGKPFSLKTLCTELNQTENQVKFLLLSLIDKEMVFKKEYPGKKVIKELYWINYDSKAKAFRESVASPEEMNESASTEQKLMSKLSQVKQQLSRVQETASDLELTQSLAAAETQAHEMQTRLAAVQDRIAAAQNAPKKKAPSSPRVYKVCINRMRNEWVKRRRQCRDFVEQMADGMEKKPKDIVKLLDLETDEMEGAVPPAKYVI